MSGHRIIPRLDIKGDYLIKGIHLEGLRNLGSPIDYVTKYYQQGADELIYMDAVASLYQRNSLLDFIQQSVRDIFIPITVGGGIRSCQDAYRILRCGADKVAVNTAATQRPGLITELAQAFGSQSVVVSIEAKRIDKSWCVFTDYGREKTQLDAIEWAKQVNQLGAGELLITSIDQEGTQAGFDEELLQNIAKAVSIPVIACGGMGKLEHLNTKILTEVKAVAVSSVLHYNKLTINDIKNHVKHY